jgi:PKD repeat protein
MMGKRLVGLFVVLAVLLASVAAPLLQPSAVLATAPSTPTNLSPTGIGVSLTPTLDASAFQDSDNDTPASSVWLIGGFTFNKNVGQGDITEYAVPAGYLTYGQTYSWQVQYRDSNSEDSQFSTMTSFTTVAAPQAAFTASPTSGNVGASISFTNTSSGGSGSLSHQWNFGDGETSTSVSPSHSYDAAGTYTVTLTVTDSAGGTDTETKPNYISIADPLVADFSASPTSVLVGQAITFTNESSGGTSPYSYQWDFGDGGTSPSENPSYAYSSPGTYSVTLTVTDAASTSDAAPPVNITVTADLMADFTADKQMVNLGQAVTFTATASGGVGTLTYQWDFDNNGTWDSTTQNPAYTYAVVGQYTVKLVVTDAATPSHNTETVTKATYITVAVGLTADFSADRQEVALGQAVKFTSLTAGVVGTLTYEWDFNNDGTVDSTAKDPSYTYSLPGTYTVVLEVTDTLGAIPVGTVPVSKADYITVTSNLLADFAADNTAAVVGQAVKFTSSSGGGVAPLTYEWDFNGDGKADSSAQNPSYTYSGAGTYKVSLKVTDSTGAADTETKDKYITVYVLAQADFTASATSVTPGQTVTFSGTSAGGTPPITYSWDFNGDGTFDSTSQEATYSYTAAGVYTVSLKVTDSKDNTDTETKIGYITVGDVAIAPHAIPAGGGVIQTADGRVLTTFPAGSYDGDATLTILEVSVSTALKPPDGYRIGSACYTVEATDGTGRVITSLVRPATITMKYTSADLSAAGNSGKNLVLAYYTEATGKWTIMNTAFNDTSQTLSATTTHFSTWAILVKNQPGGLAWWAKTLIILAALVVVAIVAWKAFTVKKPERWSGY